MQQKSLKNTVHNRNRTIQNIKGSLRKIPIISKNSLKIQLKIKTSQQEDKCSSATKNSHDGDDSTPIALLDIKEASLFEQKYQIGQKIGEGANGFVNKCKKIKTGKVYAVKSLMMDEQQIMQLKNNFLAIRALKHPNIVQYKALYIDMRKKLCNIVMQYVNLASLQKIKIHNQNQLKDIIYQLLEILKYLHDRNICYRDIKPENVLYDAENKKIKLIDFGTSKKFLRRNTRFDMLTITGTLFYRAPEMFEGGGYDQKVDIWAVGILMYEMISGKTPFESLYLSETINKIKDKSPGFQEHVWSKTGSNLKNLIKRMLKKDKNVRLSASECLRDVWFYSIKFQKLNHLYHPYNQLRKKSGAQLNQQVQNQPTTFVKQYQTLSHIIKKVDGEDYHLIDSDQQDSKCTKSSCNLSQYKRLKRKLTCSLIF